MNIKALKEEKTQLKQELDTILERAENENRELTQEEQNGYDLTFLEYEDVCERIDAASRSKTRHIKTSPESEVIRRFLPITPDQSGAVNEPDLRNYSITRAISLLGNNQPLDGLEGEMSEEMAKRAGKPGVEGRSFYLPLAALEARDLTVGTATDGGHTVFTEKKSFIEILRSRLVMAKLGATVMTGLRGDVAFPRQTAKSTAAWKGETVPLDEQSQTFDQVPMSPNKVGAFTEYSWQLLHQSSLEIEAFVRNDLSRAIAESVDLAAINGSGTGNEPEGILNTSGIGSVAGGTNGLAPTWDHIVDLETEVAIDDADIGKLAYLTNTKVRGKLKKTFVDSGSNAERVWDTRASSNPLNGYQVGVTNLVPSDLDKGTSTGVASAIIFGNFEDLLIGMWGDSVQIIVNPYTKDTEGLIRVTAFSFADVAIRRAQSFAAMQDALTA